MVKLEQNYRSTQPILDLSNQVIAQAREGFCQKALHRGFWAAPAPS